jgi:hypothetical protein
MSIVFINPYRYDPDAEDYINRVIAADVAAGDTSGLEVGVQDAINAFFVGCKNDGIWDAIKASCILTGARTLAGALVPLVGTAPTNYDFVAGDYNRETGLAGNGTTKYLDSNRNNNADPQNSKHLATYVVEEATSGASNYPAYLGVPSAEGWSVIYRNNNNGSLVFAINQNSPRQVAASTVGFIGVSRSSSSQVTSRASSTNITDSINSETPANYNIAVFSNFVPTNYSNGRLAFYSIGESLDLARLDARVSTLMSDLAAAIP